MKWAASWKADPRARPLADRHYNRHKIGAAQFAPPGRTVVLLTPAADALWITSWPLPEYVHHAWSGAWICSLFRNEGPELSSDLILDAVAATRHAWPDTPALGMVTFVDADKTRRRRSRRAAPGECFRHAGFEEVGQTKDLGLIALRLDPDRMPDPEPAIGTPLHLELNLAAVKVREARCSAPLDDGKLCRSRLGACPLHPTRTRETGGGVGG